MARLRAFALDSAPYRAQRWGARMERVELPSFAKINWILRVLGRRSDGLHEVATVMQTVTLHDTLVFTLADDDRVEIECDHPGVPADEGNLIYKAAQALRVRCGVRRGVRVRLAKRIPVGGGLGGGSSNAAAALLALARLWQLPVRREELAEIGAALGADVPFFFFGGTALATGTGTAIEPLKEIDAPWLLIVAPPVAVSTARAYAALNAPPLTNGKLGNILSVSRKIEMPEWQTFLRNDFEPTVRRSYPEVERAYAALQRAGARAVVLSGSGASVVGIFDTERDRARAAARILSEAVGDVIACAALGRAEYSRKLGECAALLHG